MDAMTVPDVWSGQDRALTAADMENMPDDEFCYELDDGVLIVSPAPSTGPGATTGTGKKTSTRASASPRTGSSSRPGSTPS
jgi:hypothetical protein